MSKIRIIVADDHTVVRTGIRQFLDSTEDLTVVAEAASGVNLWREWAKVEIAGEHGTYPTAPLREDCAGIVLSLARQEWPDMSGYADPEIVARIRKAHHAGLIVASQSVDRVSALLEDYTRRFYMDFHASAPPPERVTE